MSRDRTIDDVADQIREAARDAAREEARRLDDVTSDRHRMPSPYAAPDATTDHAVPRSVGSSLVEAFVLALHRHILVVITTALGLGGAVGSLSTSAIGADTVQVTPHAEELEEQHREMMLILCLLAAEHGAIPSGCEPYRGLRLSGSTTEDG